MTKYNICMHNTYIYIYSPTHWLFLFCRQGTCIVRGGDATRGPGQPGGHRRGGGPGPVRGVPAAPAAPTGDSRRSGRDCTLSGRCYNQQWSSLSCNRGCRCQQCGFPVYRSHSVGSWPLTQHPYSSSIYTFSWRPH